FGGWIDVSGNLWLFGGEGLMAAGGDDYSSDMWKYDVGASNWTWVDGDRGQADPGVYGALGTSAPANTPSARLSGTTWKDNAGNLWLFGGQGVASDILMGKLNDLWKYDVATGQWAWMNGDNIAGQVGVHGTLGVMAPGNKPGARSHAAGWKDNSGNLWLYGGDANGGNLGNRNDLWKYDITADQWTWMRGDDIVDLPGIYGTLGTPAPANQPGARVLAATWKDGNGNLWMFGGFGIDIGTTESELNDLWKYDVSTNEWTWMHGDNIIDQFGVYGTQGTAAPANKPGARNGAVSWTDTSGNFWLFGGFGFGETGAVGMLNDLWKYDVTSNQWAWMKGDKTPGHYGVYGTIGVAAATNLPGSRGSAVSWVDTSNNLCMIGGFAWPSAIPAGRTNDVWKYNISSNEWTWLDGSNMADPLATYGILGTPAPANIPGGRVNAMSWADSTGVVWMFGGEGLGVSGVSYMNDLWRYAIDTPVSVKMLNKQLQSGHISVYPNPITGSGSQLSIHALQKGSYTLSLYSSNGQLIYSRPLNHDGKNTTIDFILPAGISTGVYNVVLSGKDTRLSESILIKR
ncbi:MAG TPA: kelch repeat-containing protein, partial [Flavipsychrobacter sp.]|nr:kelch repeat-containing protein [Flavipsychrobacter sp.]